VNRAVPGPADALIGAGTDGFNLAARYEFLIAPPGLRATSHPDRIGACYL